ncbi:MAG: hypothetical protein ABIV13_00535 [Fimbriimonadales bacterium]
MIDILLGALLGLVSGAFGAFVLYKIVKLLGPAENTAQGTALTIAGFLLKWPLIFGLGYLSYTRSLMALFAFAIAVGVVYSATVWRALRVGFFNE